MRNILMFTGVLVLCVIIGTAIALFVEQTHKSAPETEQVAITDIAPEPEVKAPTIEEICDQRGGKWIEGGKWGTSVCIKKDAVIF